SVVLPLTGPGRAGRTAERVEPVQGVALLLGVPANHTVPGEQRLLPRPLDVVDDGEEPFRSLRKSNVPVAFFSLACGEPSIFSSPIHLPASWSSFLCSAVRFGFSIHNSSG